MYFGILKHFNNDNAAPANSGSFSTIPTRSLSKWPRFKVALSNKTTPQPEDFLTVISSARTPDAAVFSLAADRPTHAQLVHSAQTEITKNSTVCTWDFAECTPALLFSKTLRYDLCLPPKVVFHRNIQQGSYITLHYTLHYINGYFRWPK